MSPESIERDVIKWVFKSFVESLSKAPTKVNKTAQTDSIKPTAIIDQSNVNKLSLPPVKSPPIANTKSKGQLRNSSKKASFTRRNKQF